MSYFKPTILSASMGLIFAAAAADAGQVRIAPNLTSVAANSSAKVSTSFDFAKQQSLAAQTTKSGMRSHFDKDLGKATFLWASNNVSLPNLTGIARAEQARFSADHYLTALTGLSTSKNSLESAKLANLHDVKKGAIIAKYKQQINGVEVFNREVNITMDRELNLVASSGYFAKNKANPNDLTLTSNLKNEENAIHAAIAKLTDDGLKVSLDLVEKTGDYVEYKATPVSGEQVIVTNPRVKRVVFDADNGLRAAYYVELDIANFDTVNSELFSLVVDAQNNKILFTNSLTVDDSAFTYRVYANENGYPMEGPHGDVIPKLDAGPDKTTIEDMPLVTISHFEKISTSDPWLTEDATITSGNNVFAYADVVAPQGFTNGDFTAEVTGPQTFDYVLDPEQRDNSFDNRKSAIVNLFFMNNFLHDFYYDYGFDEASGNAQLSNYGRGGVEGDPLEVQAQDYAGLNNANMATPADGGRPRMQQFLWNSKDAIAGEDFAAYFTVNGVTTNIQTVQLASFGAQQYADVSGEVVRVIDGTAPVNDGCEPSVNGPDLSGKIAIIDRGACNFTQKVLNAQNDGAVAAIVVNNREDGGRPAPMGGADANVTIPSIGMTQAEGAVLYAAVDGPDPVTVEMYSNFPLKDSSFDNGIVAHEWGHYISNRLISNSNGLINFQGGNMGEGWGDFHSLMFIVLESDMAIAGNEEFGIPYPTGTYVEDFGTGIRRAPYSTDMTVNPLTFQYIESNSVPPGLPPTNGASPHAAGEVWASALWEVYVALINEHGFQTAQDKMATYLIGGYKMTPVAPTFTEARDAILATILAASQRDFDLALASFAKRGLGLGAVSPPRFSLDNAGVVESFETELATFSGTSFTMNPTFNGVASGYCSNDGVLDRGETGTVSVSIRNGGSLNLSGVTAQVTVVSDHDVTLENGGLITFGDIAPFQSANSQPIMLTLNESGTAETLELEVSFPEQSANDDIVEAGDMSLSALVNIDFEKVDPVGQQSTDDAETLAILDNWKENVMRGGDQAAGSISGNTVNTGFFASFNPGVNFGNQVMFLTSHPFQSDVAFETDAFEVGFGSNFSMSFWHFYAFESTWDGGVIEVSVNGGNWIDVLDVPGASFDVGYNVSRLTYDGVASSNPNQALDGRPVFTGRNGDLATFVGGVDAINFGNALNGQQVRLRFRVAGDVAVSDIGWFIDEITVTNAATPVFSRVVAGDSKASCDNVAPVLSISGASSVPESSTNATLSANATDRNGDTLSYTWTQTDGPAVSMSNADQSTMSFTPPSVLTDTNVTFSVSVSDGSETVSATQTVTVSNEASQAAPTAPRSSSGGGGSMGWLGLLLSPLVFMRRRQK